MLGLRQLDDAVFTEPEGLQREVRLQHLCKGADSDHADERVQV